MSAFRPSVLLHDPHPRPVNVHGSCYLCGADAHHTATDNRDAIREYSRDGCIYSVCRFCLDLIAVARRDKELDEAEERHVCTNVGMGSAAPPLQPRIATAPRRLAS